MLFFKDPKTIKLLQFWFVPLLLIIVAARQIILVEQINLNPWKGGGFGMFSTIDRPSNRVIEVRAVTAGRKEIEIDLNFDDNVISEREQLLIKTVPKRKLLTKTAQKILAATPIETTIAGVYSLDRPSERSDRQLDRVTIRIWSLHYDRQSNKIWYEPLTEKVEIKRDLER